MRFDVARAAFNRKMFPLSLSVPDSAALALSSLVNDSRCHAAPLSDG